MRAAVCVVLAMLAAFAATVALLLALTGLVVADPDRPGRLGALALASPGLRDDATDYLVDALQDQGVAAGLDDRRVRAATEEAVADPRVRGALAEAEVTPEGGIRLAGVYEAVADRLEERGRDREADRLRALPDSAAQTASLAQSLGEAARTARVVLLTTAVVAGAGAVVLGGLALLAARRRLLCFGGILLVSGVFAAVALELLPALAGPSGVAGSGWLSAARGLDEVIGAPGTVVVVALVALGGVLTLLGLRSRASHPPDPA